MLETGSRLSRPQTSGDGGQPWNIMPELSGKRPRDRRAAEQRDELAPSHQRAACALARVARHGHVTAHHARELAGDGEPEPSAPEALSGRGIGLAELLE